MKLIITGGHLSPALAFIEALPKDVDVLFVGRKYAFEGDEGISLEHQSASRLGIPFVSITTGRIQRTFTKYTLLSLLKIPVGLVQAFVLLQKNKPDGLVCFGGYISVPVAFAAYILRIPIVIHEQTLEAGFANRLIALVATKICISWKDSEKFFPKNKTILTGNPLRKVFFQTEIEPLSFVSYDFQQEKLPCIFVTGGSTGSHVINCLLEESLPAILRFAKVIHQTGDARMYGDFDRLEKLRGKLSKDMQKRYVPVKFLMPKEVNTAIKTANLVIGRSGINTITELLFLEKMALLIPLVNTQKDEQKKNAEFLKEKGLAEVLGQQTVTSSHFLSVVQRMLRQKEKYILKGDMGEVGNAQQAAGKIVEVVSEVV